MKKIILINILLKRRLNTKKMKKCGGQWLYAYKLSKYAGKPFLDVNDTNSYIAEKIQEGKPFCVARLGANELFSAGVFEFDYNIKKQKAINQLALCGGFFPADISLGERFTQQIREACRQIDVNGVSCPQYEEYFIKKYMSKDVKLARLMDFDPMKNPDNPWTKALKGKKVLVIYPIVDTIEKQYSNREKLFPNTDILPEFELKTLKAVQTVAGETDDRFSNWFEALEWMKKEALKIDFDIALIGCGAYGLPLAAKLKEAGKQAIHLGGSVQILFGIKGKRWDDEEKFDYVRQFYNEYWVYPSDEDKPKNAHQVEGGLYWK